MRIAVAGATGLDIAVDGSWGVATLHSRFIGDFNVENLLAALGALLGWNVPFHDAIAVLESRAATAMIEGQLAGWLTGEITSGRRLSFPAAATIRAPASDARRATASKTWENGCPTCARAPSDIEITAHLFATAQLMPARI